MTTADDAEMDQSWIHWFCSLKGHEFFCEVDRNFVEDEFNLIGLQHKVPNFSLSMKEILDVYDDG